MSTKPKRLPFQPLFEEVLAQPAPRPTHESNRFMVHETIRNYPRFFCDEAAAWAIEKKANVDPSTATGPVRAPYTGLWMEWAGSWAQFGIDPEDDGAAETTRFGAAVHELRFEDLRATFNADTYARLIDAGATRALTMIGVFRSPTADVLGNHAMVAENVALRVITTEAGDVVGADALDRVRRDGDPVDVFMDMMVKNLALVAAAAIGMMNCRNVTVVEHQREAKQTKKQRRPRPAPLSYSTIKLPGHTYDDAGFLVGFGAGGGTLAAHHVRGHFKHYTDEAPLLGKFTGTYWWAPQMRGSRDKGEVVQSYEVGPPVNVEPDDERRGVS